MYLRWRVAWAASIASIGQIPPNEKPTLWIERVDLRHMWIVTVRQPEKKGEKGGGGERAAYSFKLKAAPKIVQSASEESGVNESLSNLLNLIWSLSLFQQAYFPVLRSSGSRLLKRSILYYSTVYCNLKFSRDEPLKFTAQRFIRRMFI